MSFDVAYRFRQDPPESDLRDLDLVTDDGDEMPVGARGTIVSVFDGGEAYLVEFPEPVGALASVEPGQIVRVAAVSAKPAYSAILAISASDKAKLT